MSTGLTMIASTPEAMKFWIWLSCLPTSFCASSICSVDAVCVRHSRLHAVAQDGQEVVVEQRHRDADVLRRRARPSVPAPGSPAVFFIVSSSTRGVRRHPILPEKARAFPPGVNRRRTAKWNTCDDFVRWRIIIPSSSSSVKRHLTVPPSGRRNPKASVNHPMLRRIAARRILEVVNCGRERLEREEARRSRRPGARALARLPSRSAP